MHRPASARPRQRVILKRSLWVLGGRVVGRALTLGVNVALAKLLAPAGLGAFFVMMSVVVIGSSVARFGMETAVVRIVASAIAAQDGGRARSGIRASILVTAVGCAVVAVPLLAGGWRAASVHLFHSSQLAGAGWAATALLVALAVQGTMVGWFKGLHRMREVALYDDLFGNVIWGLMLVAAWIGGRRLGVDGVTWARAAAFTVVAVLMALAVRSGVASLCGPGRVRPGEVLDMGSSLMVNGVIAAITGATSDLLILAAYRPSSDVALYGVAMSVSALLTIPFLASTVVLGPFIAEAEQTPQRVERLLRGTVGLVGVPTIVGAGLLAVFGRPALSLLYGRSYGAAATVLTIMCIGQCLFVLTGPCGLTLVMTGHHRASLVLSAAGAVVSVAADLWAAPRYGAVGVAVATNAVVSLDSIGGTLLARRLTGIWTHAQFRADDMRAAWSAAAAAAAARRAGGGTAGT